MSKETCKNCGCHLNSKEKAELEYFKNKNQWNKNVIKLLTEIKKCRGYLNNFEFRTDIQNALKQVVNDSQYIYVCISAYESVDLNIGQHLIALKTYNNKNRSWIGKNTIVQNVENWKKFQIGGYFPFYGDNELQNFRSQINGTRKESKWFQLSAGAGKQSST